MTNSTWYHSDSCVVGSVFKAATTVFNTSV